jgi:uncharacterized protein YwlG (UPF0340 family)
MKAWIEDLRNSHQIEKYSLLARIAALEVSPSRISDKGSEEVAEQVSASIGGHVCVSNRTLSMRTILHL